MVRRMHRMDGRVIDASDMSCRVVVHAPHHPHRRVVHVPHMVDDLVRRVLHRVDDLAGQVLGRVVDLVRHVRDRVLDLVRDLLRTAHHVVPGAVARLVRARHRVVVDVGERVRRHRVRHRVERDAVLVEELARVRAVPARGRADVAGSWFRPAGLEAQVTRHRVRR